MKKWKKRIQEWVKRMLRRRGSENTGRNSKIESGYRIVIMKVKVEPECNFCGHCTGVLGSYLHCLTGYQGRWVAR